MDVIYLVLVALLGALLMALVSGCERLMQRAHHKSTLMGGGQNANARDADSAKAAL